MGKLQGHGRARHLSRVSCLTLVTDRSQGHSHAGPLSQIGHKVMVKVRHIHVERESYFCQSDPERRKDDPNLVEVFL